MQADSTRVASAWPVMVLAHNEERQIDACLDSILAADPACNLEVLAMANGCSDAASANSVCWAGRSGPKGRRACPWTITELYAEAKNFPLR